MFGFRIARCPNAMTGDYSIASRTLLNRHQQRRLQSIPTLTMLSGPVGLGIQLWRSWHAQRSVPVVRASRPDPGALVVAWATMLATHHDLTDLAIARLARSAGGTAADWRARVAAMTLHDLDRLWQAEAFDSSMGSTAAVCRFLLAQRVTGQTLEPRTLAERLRAEVFGSDHSRLLSEMAGLVSANRLPAILLTPVGAADVAQWLEASSKLLGTFVTTVPALPAALAAPLDVVDGFLCAGRAGSVQCRDPREPGVDPRPLRRPHHALRGAGGIWPAGQPRHHVAGTGLRQEPALAR
jgi:hypothetical protein